LLSWLFFRLSSSMIYYKRSNSAFITFILHSKMVTFIYSSKVFDYFSTAPFYLPTTPSEFYCNSTTTFATMIFRCNVILAGPLSSNSIFFFVFFFTITHYSNIYSLVFALQLILYTWLAAHFSSWAIIEFHLSDFLFWLTTYLFVCLSPKFVGF